jgi:hypothetical protein
MGIFAVRWRRRWRTVVHVGLRRSATAAATSRRKSPYDSRRISQILGPAGWELRPRICDIRLESYGDFRREVAAAVADRRPCWISPEPPHGENPHTTQGEYRKSSDLPDGNYDIFIVPPHSVVHVGLARSDDRVNIYMHAVQRSAASVERLATTPYDSRRISQILGPAGWELRHLYRPTSLCWLGFPLPVWGFSP